MAINKELLGPRTGEEEVFAVEDLVFSVQLALQKAMSRNGVTNKELAERLGWSPARVSQIFASSGPNLTLRTIAKVAHALDEDFDFVSRNVDGERLPRCEVAKLRNVILNVRSSVWKEHAANSARPSKAKLAA
jgi:transcriptional regulator with XRE-family HTH domain